MLQGQGMMGSSLLPRPSFIQISTELGLPGRSVRTVFQDSTGFIWMGLEDAGLVRYDGHEFTLFEVDPEDSESIAGQFITAINEDEHGFIWVGTQSGLSRLDPRTGKCVNFFYSKDDPSGISGNFIYDIYKDRVGHLWIGTENGFSRYIEGEGFNSYLRSDSGDPSDHLEINDIYEDHFGFIWVSSKNGVHQLDPLSGTLDHLYGAEGEGTGMIFNSVYCCTEDLAGNLWFGTETGLLRYERDSKSFKKVHLGDADRDPIETNVFTLFRDRLGFIWVGTFSDGLRILDPITSEMIKVVNDPLNDSSLRSNSVRSIMEDHSGLIWVGTKFEGVSIYDRKRETFPLEIGSSQKKPGKMYGSHVMAIEEALGGHLLVGTKRGGLNIFDPESKQYTNYSYDPDDDKSLGDNRVEDILEDSQGRVWLGNEKGFSLFHPKTGTFTNIRTYIVRELEEKDEGHLYVGTNYGIEIYDIENNAFIPFSSSNEGSLLSTESRMEIKVLYRSESGVLWIGTHHHGLYAYDELSNSLKKHSLELEQRGKTVQVQAVRAIMEDSAGGLWVGTKANGLFVWDNEINGFIPAPGVKGSPLETIFAIEEDQYRVFWLSSASGLYQYRRESGELTRFSVDYGIQGDVFEPNASAISHNGELFFGGQGGFNHFSPDQVQIIPQEARIVLSRFQLIGEEESLIPEKDEALRLSHKQNYISLSFTLLDYASPGRNEYKYKLHGLDDGWIYSQSRNYVSYSSMSPGTYHFEAYGKTPTGDWCKEPLSLSFTITPPFWKTRSFIAISVVLVVGIIAGVFHFAIVRERWQNAKLAKLVQERTKDLEGANDQLSQQKLELQRKSMEIHHQNEELARNKETLEQKVSERTKDLEEAKRKAEESDRLKTSFLANLSHEIRTPLNAIVGFTSMLEPAKNLKRGEINLVDHIQRNSGDLLRLIDNIIEVSLVEAEQLRLLPNEFPLRSFFRQLIDYFHGNYACFNSGKIEFRTRLEGISGGIMVNSDENRLRQVIHNLVDNAVKFTDSGSISLTATIVDGNRLLVSVEDTGVGISKKDQEVIFDRFRKIESHKNKLYRGSGLGLALCKHLVTLMNGDIKVTSEEDRGSRFEFTIPLEIRYIELPEKEKSEARAEVGKKTQGKDVGDDVADEKAPPRRHILVVEDEESNYVFLSAALKKLKYTFDLAKDGIEAVAMYEAKRGSYEMILMDIKLPKMNGDQAARRIREMDDDIPIVSQTAYAMEKDRSRYSSYPFNAYLPKPIRINELETVINNCLGTESKTSSKG